MRKWLWYGCLIAVLGAADMLGSAYYVYKNPDSLLGRCAMMGVVVGTRFNPFVFGYQVASANISKLLTSNVEAVAQKDADQFVRPEEPTPIEEQEIVEPEPQGEMHGLLEFPVPHIICANPDDADDHAWIGGFVDSGTVEPPLAPLVDAAVVQASGFAGEEVVTACKSGVDECSSSKEMPSWFAKIFQECLDSSKAMSEAHWLSYWFSFFSSPSMLENKGDVETSEPMDPPMSDDNNVDPYHSYHHSDCPYSGACPYTGRMPSYMPPVEPQKPVDESEENPEPMPTPKKKMSNIDNLKKWEKTPLHPVIDTMEFRDSDRTWDDCGLPFQL